MIRKVKYKSNKEKRLEDQIWNTKKDIQLMDSISKMEYQKRLMNLEEEAEQIGDI